MNRQERKKNKERKNGSDLWEVPKNTDPPIDQKEANKWREPERLTQILRPVFWDKGEFIFDADGKMICQIRGWGGLTSSGLSDEAAVKVQDSFCKELEAAINSYPEVEQIKAERDAQWTFADDSLPTREGKYLVQYKDGDRAVWHWIDYETSKYDWMGVWVWRECPIYLGPDRLPKEKTDES